MAQTNHATRLGRQVRGAQAEAKGHNAIIVLQAESGAAAEKSALPEIETGSKVQATEIESGFSNGA